MNKAQRKNNMKLESTKAANFLSIVNSKIFSQYYAVYDCQKMPSAHSANVIMISPLSIELSNT